MITFFISWNKCQEYNCWVMLVACFLKKEFFLFVCLFIVAKLFYKVAVTFHLPQQCKELSCSSVSLPAFGIVTIFKAILLVCSAISLWF